MWGTLRLPDECPRWCGTPGGLETSLVWPHPPPAPLTPPAPPLAYITVFYLWGRRSGLIVVLQWARKKEKKREIRPTAWTRKTSRFKREMKRACECVCVLVCVCEDVPGVCSGTVPLCNPCLLSLWSGIPLCIYHQAQNDWANKQPVCWWAAAWNMPAVFTRERKGEGEEGESAK